MRELLAIKSDFERFEEWTDAFTLCNRNANDDYKLNIVGWNKIRDKAAVDYALVWKPEPGSLMQFPNLKVIFSIGAGLDHLKGKNMLPSGIPVVRMVENGLTAGMVEYVVYHVLRHHRDMAQYAQQQSEKRWHGILQTPARERNVGILGLGELGGACADALNYLGFNVAGWSRTEKSYSGVRCYFGNSQLKHMLATSEILICLLPLTTKTRGILNAALLAKLPKGACLINAGRGCLQIEADILDALDSGQLRSAALDVFETEPLPRNSQLWEHPYVSITPHVASMTLPATSSVHVYENIIRFRSNQPMTHVADMARGY